jgi:hypothetical protein
MEWHKNLALWLTKVKRPRADTPKGTSTHQGFDIDEFPLRFDLFVKGLNPFVVLMPFILPRCVLQLRKTKTKTDTTENERDRSRIMGTRCKTRLPLDCGQTTHLALFPENFSQLDSEGGIDIARPPHSLCELVTNLFLLLAGQLLLLP